MALHKCCVPVVAEKTNGLKEIQPCGKLASVKERGGKGYVCAEHAQAAEQRRAAK